MSKQLPAELTHLVDVSVRELGLVIKSELGEKDFNRIESIRRFVKSREGQSTRGLIKLKGEMESLSKEEKYSVAHSFALMLELINACESAYRSWRLKADQQTGPARKCVYGRIIHVLTAHPTESRNPDIIRYFKKIQTLLQRHLEVPNEDNLKRLHELLRWAWQIPMSKQRKPSVLDEAEYIYSLALQKEILDLFIQQRRCGQPFYIRTWVGGDKDGHPGVDEKAMLGSLQLARKFLWKWLDSTLTNYLESIEPMARSGLQNKVALQSLLLQSKALKKNLKKIKKIRKGDAQRLHLIKQQCEKLQRMYKKVFSTASSVLEEVQALFKIFPGLVVPLELREDSTIVQKAVQSSAKSNAISRMLKTLASLSENHDPRFYARGFILSQTESVKDLVAGVTLAKKHIGNLRLPVVPLFESAHALSTSVEIVKEFLASPQRIHMIKKAWSGQLEIMLGYSDSAKENGSFPSRFLIYKALNDLESVIQRQGLTPIFFHGSGGSIERGGGSVQEQTEWWPPSALATVKVTVQGEMIYRNYSASEILKRQLQRFSEARDDLVRKDQRKNLQSVDAELGKLSISVQRSYQDLLKEAHFLDLIQMATPYSFLQSLRLGSRPSKRQGSVQLKSLRAIPWVLCWTQTRALMPSWWGVGSFWEISSEKEKRWLRKAFAKSSLFRSYIKALGFTLQKVDLNIFSLYLHSSKLPRNVVEHYEKLFQEEFNACKKAVHYISSEKSLLWYRPWLETSINLRSPLIHPLNILQLVALKDHDVTLLRETVTGVASGMMTTG